MKHYLLPDDIHPTAHIADPETLANEKLSPMFMFPLQVDAEANAPASATWFVAYCVGNAVADVLEEYRHEMSRGPFEAYLDINERKDIPNLIGQMFGVSVIRWSKLKEFSVCAVTFELRDGRYFPIYQCGKDFSPKL